MLIADVCPAWPGAMGALAQEVRCRSGVPVQAATTLPPSARSCRPSYIPITFSQHKTDIIRTGDVFFFGAYLERVVGTLFSKLSVVGRPESLCSAAC